jgi:hypothetical protein
LVAKEVTVKNIFLQVVLASSLAPVVSGAVAEIRFSPDSPVGPGQRVVLSVPTTPGVDASYIWRTTAGRFEGLTAGARVQFVAPVSGAAEITCVEEISGSRRFHNRTLLVAQTARTGAAAQPVPAAAPAPPAYDIGRGGFAPSGWMGDGEKRNGFSTEISEDNPHTAPNSRKWVYRPQGAGWGAVAYQYPAGNWGDKEGRNLGGRGYRELSVWARGVPDRNGRYPVIQFKAGGGSDPSKKYQASFEAEGDFVTLTGDWQRYTVSLVETRGQATVVKDMSSAISAFSFVLRGEDNPNGATFFLSEIEYR